MQLTLHLPGGTDDVDDFDEEVSVATEKDILKAGFAVARSVRTWLRAMPFVPSTRNLQYTIMAEVVSRAEKESATAPDGAAPRPKRKRKASK